MYTFNIFCFGHEVGVDEELNNNLHEWDFEFSKMINDKRWQIEFPYHGGQCAGSIYSTVFGIQITDSDNNPHFVDEIRNAKEEDYIKDYNIFLEAVYEEINDFIKEDDNFSEYGNSLIAFLKEKKPKFYSIEASS